MSDDLVETACRIWWDAEKDSKRIATCSWDEFVERTKHDANMCKALDDYRLRMTQVVEALVR